MSKGHKICNVLPGSIGEEAGLKPGDFVVSINGKEIIDIFDYQYLSDEEYLEVLIRQEDGEEWILEVEKDEDEDLGLEFENGLMDEYRSCRNKCIFCFIDQMPPGMRDTLYFKDDDSRLSFLQGNYVTLTNLTDHDIDRIIHYHLSPINISVHTTNPELRCRMLHNRFAGEALKKIDRLWKEGVEMNGQIVVCPGWNDGEQLQRTMEDMAEMGFASCSVVPVGLTKYRKGLAQLRGVDQEAACAIIDRVEAYAGTCLAERGTRLFFCSDELYLRACRPLPPEEAYEGYVQIENGVGMLRSLITEFEAGLELEEPDEKQFSFTAATGVSCGPFLEELLGKLRQKFPRVTGKICPIVNDFFGHTIDVAGLVTGRDLIAQLRGKDLGERLLMPVNMLRHGGDVFLDDVRVSDVEEALGVPVTVVEQDGYDLLDAMLGRK